MRGLLAANAVGSPQRRKKARGDRSALPSCSSAVLKLRMSVSCSAKQPRAKQSRMRAAKEKKVLLPGRLQLEGRADDDSDENDNADEELMSDFGLLSGRRLRTVSLAGNEASDEQATQSEGDAAAQEFLSAANSEASRAIRNETATAGPAHAGRASAVSLTSSGLVSRQSQLQQPAQQSQQNAPNTPAALRIAASVAEVSAKRAEFVDSFVPDCAYPSWLSAPPSWRVSSNDTAIVSLRLLHPLAHPGESAAAQRE